MRFISQRIHGTLDYAVALALISVPLLLDFAAVSTAAAIVAIAGGIGLVVYSMITDYSAGVRELISFRTHLVLDAIAASALIATPFVVGFAGAPRAFYLTVGIAVLIVVATTRLEPDEQTSSKAMHQPSKTTA